MRLVKSFTICLISTHKSLQHYEHNLDFLLCLEDDSLCCYHYTTGLSAVPLYNTAFDITCTGSSRFVQGYRALRIFDLVYVITGDGTGGFTEALSVYAYKLFFYEGDLWRGAATPVIILFLVAGFSYFYTKKSFTDNTV